MKTHSFSIVIIFFIFSIIGVGLLPLLSVDLLPSEQLPSLRISYMMPNASPEVIEQLATSPLENALSQLSSIKKISSASSYHRGYITIEFDKRVDIAFKKFEVSSLIRNIYKKLPQQLSYPEVSQKGSKNKQEENPLLTYSLHAPFSAVQIQKIAEERIFSTIAQLKGVEEVNIQGGEKQQISFVFDILKCNQYGVYKKDIEYALQRQTTQYHWGSVLGRAGETIFIKSGQKNWTLEGLENIIIKDTPFIIKLRNIAQVKIENQKPSHFYRINGQNTVNITIWAQKGINKVQIVQMIKTQFESIQKQLPQEYSLYKEYDDSEYLEKEIKKNYERSGISIVILMFFIFLTNRNLKYLGVLLVGIVVNVSLTLVCVYMWDINIHLYSLAGLAVSFGMIVDNAIIMLDHLHKKQDRRIFLALFGASLTTIAALCLVFFLPEDQQKNLLDFAKIVSINLAVSLIVALFFTPAFYEVVFKEKYHKKIPAHHPSLKIKKRYALVFSLYYRSILFLHRWKKTFIFLWILFFGMPFFLLPTQMEGETWRIYNTIFGNEYFKENIRPYIDIALGGTVRKFALNVFEKDIYRIPEKTKLYVVAQMPFGTTLEQMDYSIRQVETFLASWEGIHQFVTSVQPQYGRIVIHFDEKYEKSDLPYRLKNRLIAKVLEWEGLEWDVYGVGEGFSNSNGEGFTSFRAEMRGQNYDKLAYYAEMAAQKLVAHQRIQKVNANERLSFDEKSGKEYVLSISPQKALANGIQIREVINGINMLSQSYQPSFYIDMDNIYYPAYFYEVGASSFSNYALMHDAIHLPNNKVFKINQVASLQLENTSSSIQKEDRRYIRMIGFDYLGSKHFGDKYLKKIIEEMKMLMPVGYEMKQVEWTWDWEKAKKQYELIGILIMAVFFICAILFESLYLPLVIISVIPISFIGVFIAFTGFDFYFDQGGYAAFILLGGLTVNANIFIVNDFLFSATARTSNRRLIQSSMQKSFPIFLTIFSTMLGLVPFMIDGQEEVFWFSLACGTIGGLLFSIIGTFLVLQVWLFQKEE